MASVLEMAEAHLMNVQREIGTLKERENAIKVEIEKLTTYLQEGVAELEAAKPKPEAELPTVNEAPARRAQVFNPSF
jgi:predicted  nucleic acid-binding Zn-ribbon protein